MPFTPESRVKRTTKASWQELDGETILLVLQDEKLLGLNTAAGRIWQLSDGSRTADEIAASIASEFDGAGERALKDTLAFLDILAARGLVEEEKNK